MDTANARWEILALAIGKLNSGFEPGSKAFDAKNCGLLRSSRPETQKLEDGTRVFSTVIGGLKALISSLQSRCDGQPQKLTLENTLQDLLSTYGFKTTTSVRPIILFCRQACGDESITGTMQIKFYLGELNG